MAQNQLTYAALLEDYNRIKEKYAASQKEVTRLQGMLDVCQKDNEALAREHRNLSEDLHAAAEQNKAYDQALEAINKQNVTLSKQLEHANKKIDGLKARCASKDKKYDELKAKYDAAKEQLRLMRRRIFGKASEKGEPSGPVPQKKGQTDKEVAQPKVTEHRKRQKSSPPKNNDRKHPEAQVDLDSIDTIDTYFDSFEVGDRCPCCGDLLSDMGEEIVLVLREVPAYFYVERRHIRKRICRHCSRQNALDGGQTPVNIFRASHPNQPIPGSYAAPSLIAHILYSRYFLGLPMYRQEKAFAASGINISRQCLSNWCIKSYKYWLYLIVDRMKDYLLEQEVLHADETTLQVLREPGRNASQKSYVWAFLSGQYELPVTYYEYRPTRASSVVKELLNTWSGYLTTDGYRGYNNLPEGIIHTSCLVHIRRKFYEVACVADEGAYPISSIASCALKLIDEIFDIDRCFDGMDPNARKAMRLIYLAPKLEAFGAWCAETTKNVMERTPLKEAFNYAIGQWPDLMNVLQSGKTELDNNRAERAIKPVVMARKAFLFSCTPTGAEVTAGAFTIIETAKQNGLDPYKYLEWLLEIMPNTPSVKSLEVLDELMPWSNKAQAACKIGTKAALPGIPESALKGEGILA
ncbi:MAG: IS66 family transposase [Clostridiales bacterium]|nr:IS66 family transposase [Clostridiales bacterium]